MTTQEIENNCKKIREDMDLEVPNSDIDGMVGKLGRLSSLIGLSSECMRFAKQNLLLKQMEILKVNKNTGLSPSVLSKTIDSESWSEHGLYEYCDRINAGLVHTIEALRSIISLHKSEMEQSKWQK